MDKTVKYRFKGSNKELAFLRLLTHIAKNIYNKAVYELRAYYLKNKALPEYRNVFRLMGYNESNQSIDRGIYYNIIKSVYQAFRLHVKYRSFDGSLREPYNKNKDFQNMFLLPSYLAKNSLYIIRSNNVIYDNKDVKTSFSLPLANNMINGTLFTKKPKDELLNGFLIEYGYNDVPAIEFQIPRVAAKKPIKEIRIVPTTLKKEFWIHIVYEKEATPFKKFNNKYMGIDLGVNNLMSCVTTEYDAFLIDGRRLKSIIRLYNKRLKEAYLNLPRIKKGSSKRVKASKYIKLLYGRELRAVEAYINDAISYLFKYIMAHDITMVVVGWNKLLKTGGIKGGEAGVHGDNKNRLNQVFCQIPLSRLKDKLVLKGQELGVYVAVIEEGNTSRMSFYDKDSLSFSATPSGKRIKRGLYQTKNGALVNADINAALNILKRQLGNGNAFIREASNRGIIVPKRVQI